MCAVFAWLLWIGHAIWAFEQSDNGENVDCAIVLGAAAHSNKPSPVYEERIKHAIALYRANRVQKIIFTGGYGDGASHAESDVGAAYAIQAGVPPDAILVETQSHTSRENLIQAKALMTKAALQSAIVVSNPLHLMLAAKMAKDMGLTAITLATPTSRYRNLKSKLGFFLRELYFYHHGLITGR